jgi:hypothetical protein
MDVPRKRLAAALAALLILPVAARATECGDVDANGVVAASDALMVLKSAVGESTDMACANAEVAGELEERVIALEDLLSLFTLEGNTLVLTGVNLRIVNGEGSTNSVNGVGNLIVGYDETTDGAAESAPEEKAGSHNLVIGAEHTYSSFGAIVAGKHNASDGPGASVLGGSFNTATGENAVVVSGIENSALGQGSAVLAGSQNTADGDNAAVAGGLFNRTFAEAAFVGGGIENEAQGFASSVTGGEFNYAYGDRASVTGGSENAAYGLSSTVSGGSRNTARSFASTMSGGSGRSVEGSGAWGGGGTFSAQ